jgi:murein DD-endopeptidase MepM/ murein hydrolase activator NlpD
MAQDRAKINAKDMHQLSGFLGIHGDMTQKQIALDAMALAAQQTTLDAVKKSADDTPPETDAARILRTQQSLAESSNEMTKSLLSYTSQLEKMMKGLNYVVQEYLAPTITHFSDNLAGLAATVLGVSIAGAALDAGASMAGGYLGGKMAGGAAAGGMAAMFKTVAAFMFGPGMAIMAGLGLAGAIWYLIKNDPGTKGLFQNEGERDLAQTRVDLNTRIAEVLTDVDNQFTEEQINAAAALAQGKIDGMTPHMITGIQDRLAKEYAKPEEEQNKKSIKKAEDKLAQVAEALDLVYGTTLPTAGFGGTTPSLPAGKAWMDTEGGVADGLIEATEELTAATKANTKETKNASSFDLDYSSPQALFNSFAKLMIGGGPGNQPGTEMSSRVLGTSAGPSGTFMPTLGRISSEYGMRNHPVYGDRRMHKGIDIAAAEGTDVLAPEGGTVRLKTEIDKATGKMKGYGKYVEILNDQGEVIHRLAHLSEQLVKEGEKVVAGQQIGKVGNTGDSTGAHLHWETLKGGKQYDPRQFMANALDTTQAGSTQPSPQSAKPPAPVTVTPKEPQFVSPPADDGDGVSYKRPITPVSGSASPAGPGAPGATAATTISSLADQLETLNSSVGQLVAYTEASLRLTEKHINATRSLSNDQFLSS